MMRMAYAGAAQAPGATAGEGQVPGAEAVSIVPNRRHLDRKFPVLGFSIGTGGRSYFEVLLTTDRSLFDPADASRRHEGNFYSSRANGGLLRAEEGSSVYLAPMGVLQAFARSQPRPERIYYTLIAYRLPNGSEPAFAHPPESLPAQAPSVSIDPAFGATTSLSRLLGVREGQWVRHAPAGYAVPTPADRAGEPPARGAARPSEAEGHEHGDGDYGLPESRIAEAETGATDPGREADRFGYEEEPEEGSYATSHDLPRAGREAQGWRREEDPSFAGGEEGEEYDDGFGPMEGGLSRAADRGEPEALEGEAPLIEEDDEEFLPETEEDFRSQHASRGYGEEGEASPWATADGQADGAAEGTAEETYEETDEFHEEAPGEAAPEYRPLDSGSFGRGGATTVPPRERTAPAAPLTQRTRLHILETIRDFEAGMAGYSAINADGEFEGRFDRPGHPHPASGNYHIGLSYGFVQFTQDSGLLGELLTLMRARDRAAFDRIFGPQSGDLLRVTTAHGPASSRSPGGRSARVQPVGGADLWREPWLGRFRQAGAHPPFQAAQNELASRIFIDPMLLFTQWLGLNTERGLCLCVDRAIQLGVGGARNFLAAAVFPIRNQAERDRAIAAAVQAHNRARGASAPETLSGFQGTMPDLEVDGNWGPKTQAALLAALRELGPASPLPVPTRDQAMERVEAAAAGKRWLHRVRAIRASQDLADDELDLTA